MCVSYWRRRFSQRLRSGVYQMNLEKIVEKQTLITTLANLPEGTDIIVIARTPQPEGWDEYQFLECGNNPQQVGIRRADAFYMAEVYQDYLRGRQGFTE